MDRKDSPQTATSGWKKTASVILGLILSLVLLEAGFRLGGFVQLSLQEYGNLRSTEQKETYRILCLGDSMTRMQYPRLLEQLLNRPNIGVRFSVIDKASGGANFSVILSRVESYLTEYHPDMVVVMMGNNDKRFGLYQDFSMNDTGIFRHSLLYRFVKMRFMHFLEKIKQENIDGSSGSHPGREPMPERGRTVPKSANLSNEAPVQKVTLADLQSAKGVRGPTSYNLTGGRISKTEGPLKKAIELHPENDMAYVESGGLYKRQGKFSQAEDAYKKAIAINPLNARAYIGLGRLYREQHKFSQAEDSFRKAIEIYPRSDMAYAGLGELYMNYGIFSQAEDAFKKVLELNPTDEFTLIELGSLYRDHGELAQAEDLFRKSIGINLKRVPERTLRALASLYEEMGKPELAKKYTEMAQRMGSEDNAAATVENYLELKGILDRSGIKLVCVQYPMRNIAPLKRIFENSKGVIFVDNESLFKEAVKQSSYEEYFRDMSNGDTGHCTQKGNDLLAQNIANVILREVFKK
jgi:tetratricopeptide (TPR) repeat protein